MKPHRTALQISEYKRVALRTSEYKYILLFIVKVRRTHTLLEEWLKRAGVPKDERTLFGSY